MSVTVERTKPAWPNVFAGVIVGLAMVVGLPAHLMGTAWSIIAHGAAGTTSNSTVSVTLNDTGANLDVVILPTNVMNQNVPSDLTDSASNVNWNYSRALENTGIYGLQFAWINNPTTSATHTFSYVDSSTAFPAMAVIALAGSFGGVENCVGTANTSSTSLATGSLTPSLANSIIITGYAENSGASSTYSITGSFTIADQHDGTGGRAAVGSAYLIQTSAAASNPTWSKSGGNAANQVVMQCSFLNQPSGGGGGGETSSIIGGVIGGGS
jgi:hypothetical protein